MPLHDVRSLIRREPNAYELRLATVYRKRAVALGTPQNRNPLNVETLVCGANAADAFDCEGANGALSMIVHHEVQPAPVYHSRYGSTIRVRASGTFRALCVMRTVSWRRGSDHNGLKREIQAHRQARPPTSFGTPPRTAFVSEFRETSESA